MDKEMRISASCAKCLYDKQAHKVQDEQYLCRIRNVLEDRRPEDTAPYMVYLFDQIYQKMYGHASSYKEIKMQFNDFVLHIEESIRDKINSSEDPLLESLKYARVGNYIDFGAMNNVDPEQFMQLLEDAVFNNYDKETYQSFINQCMNAERFLLICDNCGEIVLDKLFLEQMRNRFPMLSSSVLVRGKEVLNDATEEDARYVGMEQVAEILNNGQSIAGTIYKMLPENVKQCIDTADIILAKGQGNYESLNGNGRHIFYSFLCKCDLFVTRFRVPKFTGIFIEE